MRIKARSGLNLYDDIVLQYVEWNYFARELTVISVKAFQVLAFLYKVVIAQSLPFVLSRLPLDSFTPYWKVTEGIRELTNAGLITKIKNGKYQFNDAGDTFMRSFQAMTAIRATKLKKPLKSKTMPE